MGSFKYKAFISYSHADEREADWLQRALEGWRAPSSLVGQTTAVGPIPRKLTPIFRDRNDLPAAGDLSAEIQAAAAASQFQIVVCSPSAAKSRWVNEEIKLFKKLHGPDRTLAIIIGGEPGASAMAGREAEECFPPALRFQVDAAGEMASAPAEPIAADARKSGDGRRAALSKLAAGLIGVRLDDLMRREAHRRARTAWGFAGGSIALSAVLAGISLYAVQQSRAAKTMRGEAENLIEFMIRDFRDTLEKVGRLDSLDAIGQRALTYYAAQDERALDAAALGRRSEALLLVGEIDARRNDLDAALAAYREAEQTTAELLRREPNNPDRIFDHAQSVFYLADVALSRGDFAAAEAQFNEYLRLAERLVAIDGQNPKWRLELAYATSNLGALKYEAGDFDAAVGPFERSVEARKLLMDAAPNDEKVVLAYAYALSWLGAAELRRGGFARAAATFAAQLRVYQPLLARDPDNFRALDPVVTAQRRLAEAQASLGDAAAAADSLAGARATAERLLARDPTNANWMINASHIERAMSEHHALAGEQSEAVASARRAAALARELHAADSSEVDAMTALAFALAQLVRVAPESDEREGAARELAATLDPVMKLKSENAATAIGKSSIELARHADEIGDAAGARARRLAAIGRLSVDPEHLPVLARLSLAELYADIGDVEAARRVAGALEATGFRGPGFLLLKERLASPGR